MASILNLSVKATKKRKIVAYYNQMFDRDVEHYNQVEKELREELYDKMDDIVNQGERILNKQKIVEKKDEGKDATEIVDELGIREEKFIELRNELEEEDKL